MKCVSIAATAALALTILARPLLAGGPGPAERKLRLGKCAKSGAACTFDCDAFSATCADPHDRCTLDSTDVLTGLLTLSMDESPCSQSGAVLEARLDAETTSTSFSTSDSFNYCDTAAPHCDGSIPRPNVFLCDTGDGNLDEAQFVNNALLSKDWLVLSTFPTSMANAIRSHVGSGEPVIVKADDCPGAENHSGNDSLPSVKHFCVKIHMVQRGSAPSVPPCF